MPHRVNNIGQEVNVVMGTYSGCKGKITGETEKMVYVELLGHNGTKRVLLSLTIDRDLQTMLQEILQIQLLSISCL